MSVMSTRGVITSDAVVSPKRRMPSSISLSSGVFTSVISRACESSSAVTSCCFLVTTFSTITELRTSMDDMGRKSADRNCTPPVAMRTQRILPELAMSLGRISPKSRMRNVRITVCNMKLSTGLIPSNMGPKAKLQSITMVTLTRLLAMSMVAKRRSGWRIRSSERSPLGVSSSSSIWAGESEKKAISLPETKAETRSAKTANRSAMIWARPKWAGNCKAVCRGIRSERI